uniref:DUF1118 domain-containing protein n=1 Tax=Araucaria cunninghamii TaxID=56994 RepID=A0A0D6R7J1_ARACU
MATASAVTTQYWAAFTRKGGLTLSPSFSVHGGRKIDLSNSLSVQQYSKTRGPLLILAMAPKKKVNTYDDNWEKRWFGAGYFLEGGESVDVDIVKKLEKKKVLSGVEKAGLLSKAEEFGFTLSSIEEMGLLSKAEELGLLSLAEKVASTSPAAIASVSLPLVVAAIATIVLVPDDSQALVIAQTFVATILAAGAVGLFVTSIVLSGLQEAE